MASADQPGQAGTPGKPASPGEDFQTESLTQNLLDNIPDCIARFDAECRYLFVSPSTTRLFALPREHFIGKRISETGKSGDEAQNAELEAMIRRAFAEGRTNSCEAQWMTADGERFFEVLHVPERDQAGRVVSVLGIAHDITERKVAEQALREHEFFLQSLLEAIPLPVFYKDRQGRYLGFNRAYEDFLGVPRDQLVGKNVFDTSPADLAEVYYAKDNELFEAGGEQHYESQMRRRVQGDLRDVVFNKAVFTDSQGRTKGLIGAILDITERKKMDDELRASESRFRSFADHAMDAFFLHGEKGVLLDANHQACISLGYSREELIGMDPSQFDADLPPDLRDQLRARADKGEIVTFMSHHRRKDGTTFPVEVRIREFMSGAGPRYLSTARDVSERERVEDDLRRLNRELRAISRCHQTLLRANNEKSLLRDICSIICEDAGYRLAWVGYVEHDENKSIVPMAVAGHNEGYVESLSRTRLTWSGETESGRGPAGEAVRTGEVIYVQDIATDPRMRPWRERALEHDYRSGFALPLKDDQGSVFGIILAYSDQVGGIHRSDIGLMVELSRDLAFGIHVLRVRDERQQAEAEQQRLQEQLLQAQKMESVGRLAGGIAHDFNNMLAAIMGYTELAMHGVHPSHRLHMHLQEIMKAAGRSADLTRQLLAFARRQPALPTVLDLNAKVEGTLMMLRRLIGENMHLDWRPGEDLWSIKVDPSQVDQVLANLCVNARDAIGSMGRIGIETANVRLSEAYCAERLGAVPGDYVSLVVRDDGCGMDSDTLEKVFEPFFTTKAMGQGTGLGLAMVYGIVKQNEGFIEIDSEPGQGTTVQIYLPPHRGGGGTVNRQEAPAAASLHRGSETILLVEDEAVVLDMARLMLQQCGYGVLEAATPEEASRLAEEHAGKVSLLITDVVMPGMNGQDLARLLTDRHPDLKVLFMSGYPGNAIAQHGVVAQHGNFIQKPFTMQDLAAKVREVLDS